MMGVADVFRYGSLEIFSMLSLICAILSKTVTISTYVKYGELCPLRVQNL